MEYEVFRHSFRTLLFFGRSSIQLGFEPNASFDRCLILWIQTKWTNQMASYARNISGLGNINHELPALIIRSSLPEQGLGQRAQEEIMLKSPAPRQHQTSFTISPFLTSCLSGIYRVQPAGGGRLGIAHVFSRSRITFTRGFGGFSQGAQDPSACLWRNSHECS
jgi:hypothetical protein